jgi:DNA invertase Pin-like site-specific DNA recombinase
MRQTIGYARVSTGDQDVSLQLDALRQAGCADDQIFLDVASGTHTTRPGLEACLQALAPGDTLIVWRLWICSHDTGSSAGFVLRVMRRHTAPVAGGDPTASVHTRSA